MKESSEHGFIFIEPPILEVFHIPQQNCGSVSRFCETGGCQALRSKEAIEINRILPLILICLIFFAIEYLQQRGAKIILPWAKTASNPLNLLQAAKQSCLRIQIFSSDHNIRDHLTKGRIFTLDCFHQDTLSLGVDGVSCTGKITVANFFRSKSRGSCNFSIALLNKMEIGVSDIGACSFGTGIDQARIANSIGRADCTVYFTESTQASNSSDPAKHNHRDRASKRVDKVIEIGLEGLEVTKPILIDGGILILRC